MDNPWYQHGDAMERLFVAGIAPKIGMDAIIHPNKSTDKYHPDLLISGDQLADLKSKQEPFFVAYQRFGIDPQYAVTLDLHDYLRYKEKFPGLTVIFWINWRLLSKTIGGWTYSVAPMNEVYSATMPQIDDAAKAVHKRINLPHSTSHATGIVLDVRDLTHHPRCKEPINV